MSNTTHTINGREWTAVLGDTYTDNAGVERRKAGYMSVTLSDVIPGRGDRKTMGLVVNVCPTWGHGRAIAIRGQNDAPGQARVSVADDLPALVDVLTADIPHILGNWPTYGLDSVRLTPEPAATPAPVATPDVDANAALAALLAPATPADPWDAVLAAGASPEMVQALKDAGRTPEEALAALA